MNKKYPLVSVIVPNFNHYKYLKQRLNSIFNQTYPNFEVILLDDCSTDRSQEILLEYARNLKVSHCVFNETNSGNTFIQWNKGIELAKGDYIWIAESDDFCEFNFLEKLIQPFLEDSQITLVYCQSNRVDEIGNITGSWLNHTDDLDTELFLTTFVMDGNEFIERFLIYKNVIPNASGVLFQKARVVEIDELDIDPLLKTCGDWLFYLKMATNRKVAFVYKSLNNFRYHSESVIAGAIRTESLSTISNIDLKNRRKMIDYLYIEKPYNLSVIRRLNKKIIKELKYAKGIFYLKNRKILKGSLIIIAVLDVLWRKNKLIERFIFKSSKFFKTIKK